MPQQPRSRRKATKTAQKRKAPLWGRARLDVDGGAIRVTPSANSEQDKMLVRLVEQILSSALQEGAGSVEEVLLRAHGQNQWHTGVVVQVDLNATKSRRHDEITSQLIRLVEGRPLSASPPADRAPWKRLSLVLTIPEDEGTIEARRDSPSKRPSKTARRAFPHLDSWREKPCLNRAGEYFCAYFDPQARSWFVPDVPVDQSTNELRDPVPPTNVQIDLLQLIDDAIERLKIRHRLVQAMLRSGARFLAVEVMGYEGERGEKLANAKNVPGAAAFFQNLVLVFFHACENAWSDPDVTDFEYGAPLAAELSLPVGSIDIFRNVHALPPLGPVSDEVDTRNVRLLAKDEADLEQLAASAWLPPVVPDRETPPAIKEATLAIIKGAIGERIDSLRQELARFESNEIYVALEYGDPTHLTNLDEVKRKFFSQLDELINLCRAGWAYPNSYEPVTDSPPEEGVRPKPLWRFVLSLRPRVCFRQVADGLSKNPASRYSGLVEPKQKPNTPGEKSGAAESADTNGGADTAALDQLDGPQLEIAKHEAGTKYEPAYMPRLRKLAHAVIEEPVSPRHVATLEQIIRDAQDEQPPTKDGKTSFVKLVNMVLGATSHRIELPDERVARLCVRPGRSGEGFIQFAVGGLGSVGGFADAPPLRLVRYSYGQN